LTIHDLAFMVTPECAYPTLRAYLTEVVPRSARRASRIIAVSEQTRLDLIERLAFRQADHGGVGGGRVEFRPAEDSHAARDVVRRLGIDGPYILSVGTLDPRKNYVRLLEAYAILRGRAFHTAVIARCAGLALRSDFHPSGSTSLARPCDLSPSR
jgi:glycosyltransferase involved in cell wall biosynthesis